MVRTAIVLLAAAATPAAAEMPDLADLAATWPERFVLTGTKTEPTWIEHVRLTRDGDHFLLEGGAPMGEPWSRELVEVTADGRLLHGDCPADGAEECDLKSTPAGFLATAAALGALRRGEIPAADAPHAYGAFEILCIPGEAIGIVEPVLDPCLETGSGAVIALRHRRSGAFEGPSLDPWSIAIDTAGDPNP